MNVMIDGVKVTVENGEIPEEEARAYVERGHELYGEPLREIKAILNVDPDDPEMIELHYTMDARAFHRLRRITGYLVGTLDRWNDGKRAEERDRVKHETSKI